MFKNSLFHTSKRPPLDNKIDGEMFEIISIVDIVTITQVLTPI